MSVANPQEQGLQNENSSNTHFVFENKIFKIDGCFFSITDDDHEVIFNIPMGEMTGSVRLNALCAEFGIDTKSRDFELLDLVKRGIPYVRQIRPGDIIPSEVLDGSASWQINPEHAKLAMNKLSKRLVDWLTGENEVEMDRASVLTLDEDKEMQERVNQALEKAATLIKRRKEEVFTHFDDIAKELAYIEALRDYYSEVYRLFSTLRRFQEIYRDDPGFIQEIERMRQLMKPPIEAIKHTFDRVDLETIEILPLLKSYEQKVSFIRTARDDLHLNTTVWQDLKELWKFVPHERCDEAKVALNKTYKFLAKNFTVSYSW